LILADTSVWIDHFRSANRYLRKALNEGRIVIHPWIVAELALGSLQDRTTTLRMLDNLPHVRMAQISELRLMVETRHLYGVGIGLIDAHLVASVLLSPPTLLWTRDRRLRQVAEGLGIHARLP
jgi:predicted nucleic acid-binding protein